MAIVLRFNTIIIQKPYIEMKYPGGLDRFRQNALELSTYYEDSFLSVAVFMGGYNEYWDLLVDAGMHLCIEEKHSNVLVTNQLDTLDECEWLETTTLEHHRVCWFRGQSSGYVSGPKPYSFIHSMSESVCPSCLRIFGIGAISQSISLQEKKNGPIASVLELEKEEELFFVIKCPGCEIESIVDSNDLSSLQSWRQDS